MGTRTAAVKEAAAALKDLWTAQSNGDQAAQEAAIDRGHRAIHGTSSSTRS